MRLTGGEIVAEWLIRERVPYVAGIPGHGNIMLVDALRDRRDKIGFIQTRSEQGAVHLADGYFRVTGTPLAVTTSIGPGACNAVIAMATAYVESSAVLLLTADAHTYMRGHGIFQEIDRDLDSNFVRIIEPVSKRAWLATEPGQLPSILQRAFTEMLTGRPGPVAISLPMNVQADAADVELADPAGRHRAQHAPLPDPAVIEKIAQALMEAERPVIYAGGGINAAGAWRELRAVAEFTGAAVCTTFQGKGCFPEDHALAGLLTGSKGTRCGKTLCLEADVILAVGVRFVDQSTSSYRPGHAFNLPRQRLFQIDLEPYEIGKNYPVEIGVISDAKTALAALLDCLKRCHKAKDLRSSGYANRITKLRTAWRNECASWDDPEREPMRMASVMRALRGVLDRDAIVTSGSGNAQAHVLQMFDFYEPRTNITSAGFSCMGFSVPAAIGCKLAKPDTQVVAVVGDGDYLMNAGEFATAVQHGLPIVVVVCNNHGWHSIRDLQMAVFGGRDYATEFLDRAGNRYSPNFAKVAEAFGGHGERVTKGPEVGPALRRALRAGKPALVECITSSEFPDDGSPAVGWWDVPIPAYLSERRRRYEAERNEEYLA